MVQGSWKMGSGGCKMAQGGWNIGWGGCSISLEGWMILSGGLILHSWGGEISRWNEHIIQGAPRIPPAPFVKWWSLKAWIGLLV